MYNKPLPPLPRDTHVKEWILPEWHPEEQAQYLWEKI